MLSAAPVLSLPILGTFQASPRSLLEVLIGGGLFVVFIAASPDLCAFAGLEFQGPPSMVSRRLKASLVPSILPFDGLDGRPRRIGAMASRTFSRACMPFIREPVESGDLIEAAWFFVATGESGSGRERGESTCFGGGV